MYPDTTFLELTRIGLALYEGYLRRGNSAQKFGFWYTEMMEKMFECERNMKIFNFLDMKIW